MRPEHQPPGSGTSCCNCTNSTSTELVLVRETKHSEEAERESILETIGVGVIETNEGICSKENERGVIHYKRKVQIRKRLHILK